MLCKASPYLLTFFFFGIALVGFHACLVQLIEGVLQANHRVIDDVGEESHSESDAREKNGL